MNETEVRNIIFDLLKKVAPDTEPASLQPDDNIRSKLEIDSFDSLQFVVALDERFGFETPEEDYGKIQTLRTLTAYVMKHAASG